MSSECRDGDSKSTRSSTAVCTHRAQLYENIPEQAGAPVRGGGPVPGYIIEPRFSPYCCTVYKQQV